jgi:hypothetical protein
MEFLPLFLKDNPGIKCAKGLVLEMSGYTRTFDEEKLAEFISSLFAVTI